MSIGTSQECCRLVRGLVRDEAGVAKGDNMIR
jgi:hypothetical protein